MNETAAMPDANVTQLLERVRQGEREVVNELMPLIYDELRRLAQRYMGGERANHTLQATALVHEAYLQLVGSDGGPWQNRAHFFAVAATTIRRILVHHARRVGSQKRGGDWKRAAIDPDQVHTMQTDEQILAVDEALTRLAAVDPAKARLVELRFFAGMTTEEMAESLGVSPRTVAREWDFARAWLSRELSESASRGG